MIFTRIFGDIVKAWRESGQARFNIIASVLIGGGAVYLLGRKWK